MKYHLLLLLVGASTCMAGVSFETLADLPGGDYFSKATDVSADGRIVVGFSDTETGHAAFRWENGVMEQIVFGDTDWEQSEALAVSGDGTVIVGKLVDGWDTDGFRWEDGEWLAMDLPFEGEIGDNGCAVDVSGDGSVIIAATAIPPFVMKESLSWNDGTVEWLPPLVADVPYAAARAISSDGATIIGSADDGSTPIIDGTAQGNWNLVTVRWIGGTVEELGDFSAFCVNSDGSIIAGSYSGYAARWKDGQLETFEGLPQSTRNESRVFGISGDGSILVGRSFKDADTGYEAVVWFEEGGFRPVSLNALVDSYGIDRKGFFLKEAMAISEDGTTIVGYGENRYGLSEAFRIRLGNLNLSSTEWETVYPEVYPNLPQMPMNGIASRRLNQDSEAREYLIGSCNGKLLWGHPDEESGILEWEIIQTPLTIDILAVSVLESRWLIGGEGAQLYQYSGPVLEAVPEDVSDSMAALVSQWEAVGVSPAKTSKIETIDVLGGAIVVNNSLASADGGNSWKKITILDIREVADVVAYHGKFLALGSDFHGLHLIRSFDGMNWHIEWTIPEAQSCLEVELMLLPTEWDTNGLPVEESIQLYAFARSGEEPDLYYTAIFTPDGVTWYDCGSTIQHLLPDPGYAEAWNPMGLSDAYLGFPHPERRFGEATGNLLLNNHTLESFRFGQWAEELKTNPGQDIAKDTISLWDRLTFVTPGKSVLSINEADRHFEVPNPEFDGGIVDWEKLLYSDGVYYGQVILSNRSNMVVTNTVNGRMLEPSWIPEIIASDSLLDWIRIPQPDNWKGQPLHLVNGEIFTVVYYFIGGGNYRAHFYGWAGQWIEEEGSWGVNGLTVVAPSFAWLDAERNWITFHDRGEIVIDRLNEDLEWIDNLAILNPDSVRGQLTTLTCPDGERLVLHGETAELFIIERDGTYFQTNIWKNLPEHNHFVRDVIFINGWYYLLGSASLRTRDFREFEEVVFPVPGQPVDLVGFAGQLYAFFPDVVYRRPLETGYLDSVIRKQGWRHSYWLGWFNILDESEGDIHHLLLGDCRVTQVNEEEFWINTESLGWIWMNKAWSPWLWRMDDGHWYKLDHENWPARAWDADSGEWVDLVAE